MFEENQMRRGSMAFSDTLRELASKAQDLGEKGFKSSKELLQKGAAKAQELGEIGVLKLEIRQLEAQVQKILTHLGVEVYAFLVEEAAGNTLSAESPTIKGLLEEIGQIKEKIEKKEEGLQKKGDDAS
jgi:hypothetical protein